MDDSIDSVRRDIAETRARLSDTLAELDNRVDTVKHAVTQTANPLPAIREHPWIALGLALGAGIAIGMSGADRTAVAATTRGVKKAGPALMGGAKAAASGIKDMVTGNGGDSEAVTGNRLASYGVLDGEEEERPSATHRVLDAVRDTIESRIDEVTNSLLEASREFLVGRHPSGI
jgi:hypothetical protein